VAAKGSKMITLPNLNLIVSFVISTYNRRDVLLHTLRLVQQCGIARNGFEILVVDNASRDGTARAIEADFPDVRVFELSSNRGACAKNVAIQRAQGRYIVFLDDDSYPQPGSIARMVRYFETDPSLGAAVFDVNLPDGSRECSAYPDVFIGCGTGFRRRALDEVGMLPTDFFMQAEEYDLSLRLLDAGWEVRRFDDLHVTHLKTPGARHSARTMRLDVRNNILIARRYLPAEWSRRFAWDWTRRYWRIASSKKQRLAFALGLAQGLSRTILPWKRRPVRLEVFDRFTRLTQIEERLKEAIYRHRLQSVLLLDYGKNVLPYRLAARRCDLEIVAIADNRLVGTGRYDGIPIVNDWVARRLNYDAAIVSNSSPVHAQARVSMWKQFDNRPVIDLLAESCPAGLRHTHGARERAALAA
jgi:GT2 family glycosyltransferase